MGEICEAVDNKRWSWYWMKMQTQEGLTVFWFVLFWLGSCYCPRADHFDFTLSARKRFLTASADKKANRETQSQYLCYEIAQGICYTGFTYSYWVENYVIITLFYIQGVALVGIILGQLPVLVILLSSPSSVQNRRCLQQKNIWL